MGLVIYLREGDRFRIEGDHRTVLLKGEDPCRMIVYSSLQCGIEVRQNFMDIIRQLYDGPYLFRIGQARKDMGDLEAFQQHQDLPSSGE